MSVALDVFEQRIRKKETEQVPLDGMDTSTEQ